MRTAIPTGKTWSNIGGVYVRRVKQHPHLVFVHVVHSCPTKHSPKFSQIFSNRIPYDPTITNPPPKSRHPLRLQRSRKSWRAANCTGITCGSGPRWPRWDEDLMAVTIGNLPMVPQKSVANQQVPGWWYTYPSEKYESQLEWLFPIYGKIIQMLQTTNQFLNIGESKNPK